MKLRDVVQELRELGVRGTLFRAGWELRTRSGLMAAGERTPVWREGGASFVRLPFGDAWSVGALARSVNHEDELKSLVIRADEAGRGRITAFSRWIADFGHELDWHRDPRTGRSWPLDVHWSRVFTTAPEGSDIKLTWELGRFPHAFDLARASAAFPDRAAAYASVLLQQIESFINHNSYAHGLHWASGLEIAYRLISLWYAANVFHDLGAFSGAELAPLRRLTFESATHIERHFEFARRSANNDHLIGEAVALYLAGRVLPDAKASERWTRLGIETLTTEAGRQFYPDGTYLLQSHTYHRAVLQFYLLAFLLRRGEMKEVPVQWTAALERSLIFLHANQNPSDGRLPNYGSNDGGVPARFSNCDYADFRPLLQSISLAIRGERLYDRGQWDEEAAWWLGAAALEMPLGRVRRTSAAFAYSGYYVMRGADERDFVTFRCGSLRSRFSQMDMLHVDLWWRGQNLLADGGAYLYNGPEEWHSHFMTTASHNTVVVDGHDQMVHHRQFKVLYWTRARAIEFTDSSAFVLAAGEHYAFARYAGRPVHRRSVLFVKTGLTVVADFVAGGPGQHTARLHWLGGEYPHRDLRENNGLVFDTSAGDFSVSIFDRDGRPAAGETARGVERPPRGWLSRYYGERVPVPSFTTIISGGLPLVLVTIACAGVPAIEVSGNRWRIKNSDSFAEIELTAESIRVINAGPART